MRLPGHTLTLFCSLLISCTGLAQESQSTDLGQSAKSERWQVTFLESIGEPDRAQTGEIKNVAMLSSGNQALTCGLDGIVCLWDIGSRKIIRRFADRRFSTIYCIAVLQDETRLLAAGNGPGVGLWDIASGELIKVFEVPGSVVTVAVMKDEKSFLCGDRSGNIKHFEFDKDVPVAEFRDGSEDITALAITPDQTQFLTGGGNGSVSLWQFGKAEPVESFEGLSNWTCCLQLSEDGQQLFGCDYNGNVALWNFTSREQIWHKKELADDICWGRFIDEKSLVVVDTDDAFYLLNRETGKAVRKQIVIPAAAGFDLSPDRKSLWSGGTNLLCGWDLETAERLFPDDQIMPFAQGIDQLVAYRGMAFMGFKSKGRVDVWDLSTGKQRPSFDFTGKLGSLNDSRIIPLKQGLAYCSDSGIALADYQTGEILKVKKFSNNGSFRPSLDREKLLYVDQSGRAVRSIDPITKRSEKLVTLNGESHHEVSNLYLMGENHLVIQVDQYPTVIQIWAIESNKMLRVLSQENGLKIMHVAGGLLLGATDGDDVIVFAKPTIEGTAFDESSINDLINRLDDDSWQVRDIAQKRLADGGKIVADFLDSFEPQSLESQVRVAKVKRMIANSGMPQFDKPLTGPDWAAKGGIDAWCADAGGKLFLICDREDWRSRLSVCYTDQTSWKIDSTHVLRSRVSTVVPVEGKYRHFAIGYRDGTLEIIKLTESDKSE